MDDIDKYDDGLSMIERLSNIKDEKIKACVYRNKTCLSGGAFVVLLGVIGSIICFIISKIIFGSIIGSLSYYYGTSLSGLLFKSAFVVWFFILGISLLSFSLGSIYCIWKKKPLTSLWNYKSSFENMLVLTFVVVIIGYVIAILWIIYGMGVGTYRFVSGGEVATKIMNTDMSISVTSGQVLRGIGYLLLACIISVIIIVVGVFAVDKIDTFLRTIVIRYTQKCISVCENGSLVNVLFDVNMGQIKEGNIGKRRCGNCKKFACEKSNNAGRIACSDNFQPINEVKQG